MFPIFLYHDLNRSRGFLFIGTEGSPIAENYINMFSEQISFNELPQAIVYLIQKVENLEALVAKGQSETRESDRWLNLKEFQDYHPDHPAAPTIYAWVGQRLIPYHKKGKKLMFLKSEIDLWLKQGRRKTSAEIQAEAAEFVAKKGRIVK